MSRTSQHKVEGGNPAGFHEGEMNMESNDELSSDEALHVGFPLPSDILLSVALKLGIWHGLLSSIWQVLVSLKAVQPSGNAPWSMTVNERDLNDDKGFLPAYPAGKPGCSLYCAT
jgi:hypothetical protein